METREFSAIIDLAISKEEEAYDFYMELVKMVDDRPQRMHCRSSPARKRNTGSSW